MTTQSHSHSSRSAVSSRFVALLLVGLAFILTGCGPKIKITWVEPKSEIHEGTILRLNSAEVGKVTDVATENGLFTVEARIYRKAKDQVRTESAFLVKKPADNTPAYIEVSTLRAESGPIADGTVFKGSENRLDLIYRSISSDWPKTLTMLAVIKGSLLLVLLCFKRFRQLFAVVFCLAAGAAGAYYASPYAKTYLQRWVPIEYRPDLLAYVAGFLAAYLIALLLVALLRAPMAVSRE